jgi:hypothetical protein
LIGGLKPRKCGAVALKTTANDASVKRFLDGIADAPQRADAIALTALIAKATGEKPRMWGKSIVGFGEFRFRYPSGREGDWLMVGFSPRAKSLSIYVTAGLDQIAALLPGLGEHSTGKGCIYVDRLADVDAKVLAAIMKRGVAAARAIEKSPVAAPSKRKSTDGKAAKKKKTKKPELQGRKRSRRKRGARCRFDPSGCAHLPQ